MATPIYIIGAGGFGREVLWLIREINAVEERFEVLGFVDDNEELHGETLCGVPVVGGDEVLANATNVTVAMGIGIPSVKQKIIERLKSRPLQFPSLIAPDVKMSEYVEVGEGAVITSGCILTTQVSVGDFAMINLGCTIGHDVKIGKGATLSPGANVSGYVTIGDFADIGTNTTIIPGKSVGENAIIGAGAVVIRDIPARATAVGNPAKVIKQG